MSLKDGLRRAEVAHTVLFQHEDLENPDLEIECAGWECAEGLDFRARDVVVAKRDCVGSSPMRRAQELEPRNGNNRKDVK